MYNRSNLENMESIVSVSSYNRGNLENMESIVNVGSYQKDL